MIICAMLPEALHAPPPGLTLRGRIPTIAR
jgi:hypothetical protein